MIVSFHPRRRVLAGAIIVVLAGVAGLTAVRVQHHGHQPADRGATVVGVQQPTATPSDPGSASTSPAAGSTHPSQPRPSRSTPVRPAGLTRGGMWWGVDSSGPITAAAIDNVRGWYQGATPQFWGRYLSGDYAVTREELAFARSQHIYVYLLVNDSNCSQCSGGDICGNDQTAAQAHADALAAITAARGLGVRRGAVLFKDIEQVSSCRGEPSGDYLIGWWQTLRSSDYRTGFYGNTNQQNYDFPVGYCAAVAHDPRFRRDVVLDMNEPEPRIGAPQGSTGPKNAPPFAPFSPSCAARTATVIWQYGESTDQDNYTDVDQARPDLHGLLAPDGTIS